MRIPPSVRAHHRLRVALLIALLCTGFRTLAQTGGIAGLISDEGGNVLSYASIFVKERGTGTTANAEGSYEISLPPGRYEVVFQHLGRRTEVRTVNVKDAFLRMDVTLVPQEIMLAPVTVGANDEDPAYSIMRRAIAKANYHRNVLDSYSARVYIKGSGKLKDYPWLAKRALEKEGIEKGRVFVSESISEIKYTRPNKFEEKVISIRSDGKDNNTSPNGYIFGSFYEPEIAGTVSPFSPRAFSYYKFEYLGTFNDRDYAVSRIRVIPRSKGDNVVDGTIYIVEDDWSLHSVDVHTIKLGIYIYIKSTCAPIEDKVWLPVSHQFTVEGKVFGFDFEYKYLASVSDYRISVNKEVYVEKMEVIDEKKEPEVAATLETGRRQTAKEKRDAGQRTELQERLAQGDEITRKELRSLMREYEREEQKQQPEPEVLSEVNFAIDSGAYKKDSLYWAKVRPIPLTVDEIKGYEKSDSLAAVERQKEEGDTLKRSKHKGFQPWDLIIGDHYKIGKHANFRIYFPMAGFNTAEGFNIVYRTAFGIALQDTNRTRLTFRPVARYAFSREMLTGYLNVAVRNSNHRLDINGGRYISQFNSDDPILPVVNTFTTLLLEKNLMKIYARDFVEVNYRRTISPFLTVKGHVSWSDRSELSNTSDFKLLDRKGIEGYTPNAPVHEELDNTGFPHHQALIGAVGISARPWLKFRIRNGQRRVIQSSSPTLTLDYRKGFDGIGGSDVDFDHLEAGVRHAFRVGVKGSVDFWLRGGVFPGSSTLYFMDYKHFLGNQTPFSTTDPVGSFRLLDYYRYSSDDLYFSANVHYQFRKFLVTTIPEVRLMGIRENVFVNYLATPTSRHYTELGYSIDGVLRLFRLEFAAAFRDGQYAGYGVRLGITTNFENNFSD